MNRKYRLAVTVAFCGILTLTATCARAELIVNGGFETGDFSGWSTYGSDAAITSLNNPEQWTPGDGNYSARINNDSGVYQSFETVAGQTYHVSMAYQVTPTIAILTATAGDTYTDGTALIGPTTLPTGGLAHQSPYTGSYSVDFVAATSLTKIVISNPSGLWASFDDVSVTGSAIPEPSSIMLSASCLMVLLAYAWRKQK